MPRKLQPLPKKDTVQKKPHFQFRPLPPVINTLPSVIDTLPPRLTLREKRGMSVLRGLQIPDHIPQNYFDEIEEDDPHSATIRSTSMRKIKNQLEKKNPHYIDINSPMEQEYIEEVEPSLCCTDTLGSMTSALKNGLNRVSTPIKNFYYDEIKPNMFYNEYKNSILHKAWAKEPGKEPKTLLKQEYIWSRRPEDENKTSREKLIHIDPRLSIEQYREKLKFWGYPTGSLLSDI